MKSKPEREFKVIVDWGYYRREHSYPTLLGANRVLRQWLRESDSKPRWAIHEMRYGRTVSVLAHASGNMGRGDMS